MPKAQSLVELARNRKPVEELLAGLMSDNRADSLRAGQELVQSAKELKLPVEDYLRLAVDTSKGEFKGSKLNGFEASLAFLGLPLQDNFDNGIVLQAASDVFNTFPGVRALFPPVIDNVLQWKYRQDNLEDVSRMVGQSRTINGVEMIMSVVQDQDSDYQQIGVIAEGSRIPMRSIRATEKSVTFHKFGGGFEFTYEFERRASLDMITPYAARMLREVAIGQCGVAAGLLINGDGTSGNPAAPVTTATSLAALIPAPPTIVAGRINWEIFLKWLMVRAQAGAPIDTIVGNYDMYLEWLRMFSTPTANAGPSQGDQLRGAGVQVALQNPGFNFNINFAVASAAPANKLIGFIKNETLEELVENGSDIEESVRAVENQKVRYVKTYNKGYRLVFGDTRSILNLV